VPEARGAAAESTRRCIWLQRDRETLERTGLFFQTIFAAWHKRNASLCCLVAWPLATLRNGDDR
jgi:hypothetical protein